MADYNTIRFQMPTQRVAGTDVAQLFSPTIYTNSTNVAIGALITCEDNDIRFTFGTATPTQGANPVGHFLPSGMSIQLWNAHQIETFKFINAVNAVDGVLQVTFEI